jgi:lysozyme family protein
MPRDGNAPPAPPPGAPAAPKKGTTVGVIAAGIIAATIALEGGYVNHPSDPGGETKDGITKRVAVEEGYTGPMRALPRELAVSIYYRRYFVAPGYAPLVGIDAAVAEELFDTTVNMGPTRPSRWFQQSINTLCDARIAEDGRVGPATVAAYATCQKRVGAARLCIAMLEQLDGSQKAEYARLVRANPKLKIFYKGWVTYRIRNVDRRKCGKPTV